MDPGIAVKRTSWQRQCLHQLRDQPPTLRMVITAAPLVLSRAWGADVCQDAFVYPNDGDPYQVNAPKPVESIAQNFLTAVRANDPSLLNAPPCEQYQKQLQTIKNQIQNLTPQSAIPNPQSPIAKIPLSP